MAHYTLQVNRNKPYEKLKEKEMREIEQEALQGLFELIKKHVHINLMTEEGSGHTTIEYDVIVETPKIYRNKENKQNLDFNYN